jgi:hypothetical protein
MQLKIVYRPLREKGSKSIMSLYTDASRAEEVEELLKDLKSATDKKNCTALFNRVTFVLTHNLWFNAEQRNSVIVAAKASLGLTNNQKKLNLPSFREEEDRWTDEAYYYEGCEDYGSYD